jgi:cytoskeleton protein RodZ
MDSSLSIGETLRRRREERALTPEQAASKSKVPLRLVQMLESDDYQLLPDPLYLVRLLHEYATFLDLDAAALNAEFQRVMHRPPRPAPPPAPAPAPRVPSAIPWKQVLWTVVAILVVTPLVVIALSLASKRSADQAGSPPPGEPKVERPASGGSAGNAPAQGSESAAAVESRPPAALPETTVTPVVTTPAAPGPPQQGAAARSGAVGHILVVRAQEVTWLSVRADEKDAREVLLQPEQVARFEAQTGFRVIVGNAGGVTLSLDGTPLPPLGRSGEVIRDLVLPPVRRDAPALGASAAVPAR